MIQRFKRSNCPRIFGLASIVVPHVGSRGGGTRHPTDAFGCNDNACRRRRRPLRLDLRRDFRYEINFRNAFHFFSLFFSLQRIANETRKIMGVGKCRRWGFFFLLSFSRNFIFNFNNNCELYFSKKKGKVCRSKSCKYRVCEIIVKFNWSNRNTFLSYVFFPRNIFLTKNLRID